VPVDSESRANAFHGRSFVRKWRESLQFTAARRAIDLSRHIQLYKDLAHWILLQRPTDTLGRGAAFAVGSGRAVAYEDELYFIRAHRVDRTRELVGVRFEGWHDSKRLAE
jgi:hypothetical protein